MEPDVELDVHSKSSVFVIQNERGEEGGRGEVPTSLKGFTSLRARFRLRASTLVALESGTIAFFAARKLSQVGLSPVVVDAREVRVKAHRPRQKSDTRDAVELRGTRPADLPVGGNEPPGPHHPDGLARAAGHAGAGRPHGTKARQLTESVSEDSHAARGDPSSCRRRGASALPGSLRDAPRQDELRCFKVEGPRAPHSGTSCSALSTGMSSGKEPLKDRERESTPRTESATDTVRAGSPTTCHSASSVSWKKM